MTSHSFPTTRARLNVEQLDLRTVPSAVVPDGVSDPQHPIDIPVSGTADDPGQVTVDGRIGQPLRALPRARFAVASGPGQTTQVNVYDSATNALTGILTPFGRDFTGGARVTTADLTGDGIEDIVVAAGPGSAPWVKVFDGATLAEVQSFLAYAGSFTGGVYVAAGDVTGDGRADIVTGAGPGGGPHVEVFDGAQLFPGGDVQAAVEPTPKDGFFAYDPGFHGGVSVAVGDVNGDGVGDVVTGAGPGGGPHVKAFSGKDHALLASFFAYDAGFTGGVYVAAGDPNGTGRAEIVTGPMAGGGPMVRVFDGGQPVASYCPFDGDLRCGSAVAVRDVDGDGRAELVVATGPGTAPKVRVLNGQTGDVLRDFPALTPDYTGGMYVG